MNKKIILIFLSFLVIFGLFVAIYQYVREFQADFVGAYTTKPANGHSWSEMECTSDLCVKSGAGVGIGTEDAGSNKLKVAGNVEVVGSINVATNVCLASGACLTDIAGFIGSQPIAGGTNHSRKNCTDAGGELVDIGLANPVCRFNAASCPSSWTQFNNWSTNTEVICNYCSYYAWIYAGAGCTCNATASCTAAGSAWGDGRASCAVPSMTCSDAGGTKSVGGYTCWPTTTQIGCY